MSREYIPLFLDFNEITQDLSDEECGRLVRAIVDYANDQDYESRLCGAEKIAFRFLKGTIDRNAAISEKRAQAGAKKPRRDDANDSKPEQTETNENKTEQTETNSLNKNNNKKQEQKTKTKNENEERFARFWAAYPRKEAKATALKAFLKIAPDDAMLQTMLTAIDRFKQTEQWQEDGGKYIPHPTTWLNQRRWEDEPPKASTGYQKPRKDSYDQRPNEENDLNAVPDWLVRYREEKEAQNA